MTLVVFGFGDGGDDGGGWIFGGLSGSYDEDGGLPISRVVSGGGFGKRDGDGVSIDDETWLQWVKEGLKAT